MGNRHGMRAGKLSRSVASMSLRRRLAPFGRRILGSGSGTRLRLEDSAGLFRTAPPWRRLFGQSMQRRFEFVPVGFAQRRTHAAFDNLVQFRQVHVDPFAGGGRFHNWLSNSRKRGTSGKPRTSLMGRFGLFV
jgi:hypothetical protein